MIKESVAEKSATVAEYRSPSEKKKKNEMGSFFSNSFSSFFFFLQLMNFKDTFGHLYTHNVKI